MNSAQEAEILEHPAHRQEPRRAQPSRRPDGAERGGKAVQDARPDHSPVSGPARDGRHPKKLQARQDCGELQHLRLRPRSRGHGSTRRPRQGRFWMKRTLLIAWKCINWNTNSTRTLDTTALYILSGFRRSDLQRQAGTWKLGIIRQGAHADQGFPVRRERRVLMNNGQASVHLR